MIWCFDLDHTLCVPNLDSTDPEQRYGVAEPIHEMIDIVQRLKARGDEIIIHTARGMLTYEHDSVAAFNALSGITRRWLQDHGVPYDKLVFGKPYAHAYVDDKAMVMSALMMLKETI